MLSENEVMQELFKLEKAYVNMEKVPGARSIYLAHSWWTDTQIDATLATYESLLKNPTIAHIHVPLMHQYKGMAFTEDGDFKPDFEWATMTYKADIRAIDNSDLIVATYPADAPDMGEAVEIGYAIGTNKPVVMGYYGDINKNPVNLMVSFGADAYVYNPEEFASFDFLDIESKAFEGKII
ncbi:nucleoside 2-deoxyribosyltransferase [Weissella coleopterorum]|uniref:Nucleoside 2-deoxyribosyltransferase n=1 Tax=Weissella coleopterorum TaxID=2714949 RepID=A0A6G8AYL0_9LACO|nr:nucleoside 2-deoxyribosyltransferase [Weissella coleopterorum]QIL50144.1 nucleoside 2-deoxyribosyltransferase [Weissella coleopterorum]